MPSRNGAIGAWNPVELSLFTNDWPSLEKAVMLAMLVLSPNPYGVYSVAPWQILGTVQAIQCISDELAEKIVLWLSANIETDGECDWKRITNGIANVIANPVTLPELIKAIENLHERGSIQKYAGNIYWIKDRWSYTGNTGNPKHRKGAQTHIQTHFPAVWPDFAEWYEIPSGLPTDSQPEGNGIAKPLNKDKSKLKNKPSSTDEAEEPAGRKRSERVIKRNEELIPLRDRLAAIISRAESKYTISNPADNGTDAALDALRQLVSSDKVPEGDIEPIIRHHFLMNDENRVSFNLKTRRHIARWRKNWKGAKNAFDAMRTDWEMAGRPRPGTIESTSSTDIPLGR